MASGRTPVRVRGKRHAPEQDQLREIHERYHRKHKLDATESAPSFEPRTSKKVKRSNLSRLEELPTELLEFILLYSANLDLPLVSHTLLSRLSHGHVRQLLGDRILHTITPEARDRGPAALENVQQLFERRFFTWSVFQQWLFRQARFVSRSERLEALGRMPPAHDDDLPEHLAVEYLTVMKEVGYLSLTRLRIPKRALISPLTGDRLLFLRFWAIMLDYDSERDRFYQTGRWAKQSQNDLVREALLKALETHSVAAARLLLLLVDVIDDELIEHVVIDGGCDPPMVERIFGGLVQRSSASSTPISPHFNPLNPVLWAWADEPAQVKSGQGEYLKNHLRVLLK